MNIREILHRDNAELHAALANFLPIACKLLKVSQIPTIKLLSTIENDNQPTFGKFSNKSGIIYVATRGRHTNDVLRTVSHELVHYKQQLDSRLRSGETGSDNENEANAVAAIIMRVFNKKYPQYLQ